MSKQHKNYLPPSVRRAIKYAHKQARMDIANCALPDDVKDAMTGYLNSWVAGPLSQVLAWDEGELSAREIADWGP